ncbi:hypothetical protein P280DRAFT_326822 [Massarina eburnea CBS 473.64]|uniref:Uncharacterized protein n=1 Tax=Massarina eburnea CBS 473.64 TaxID=1395130 RepID=A0A6A6RYZ6_9PLEO|nr:hypothetical protein P280DRAFT_326822 [Massarina eburnea CBS 473.64]
MGNWLRRQDWMCGREVGAVVFGAWCLCLVIIINLYKGCMERISGCWFSIYGILQLGLKFIVIAITISPSSFHTTLYLCRRFFARAGAVVTRRRQARRR